MIDTSRNTTPAANLTLAWKSHCDKYLPQYLILKHLICSSSLSRLRIFTAQSLRNMKVLQSENEQQPIPVSKNRSLAELKHRKDRFHFFISFIIRMFRRRTRVWFFKNVVGFLQNCRRFHGWHSLSSKKWARLSSLFSRKTSPKNLNYQNSIIVNLRLPFTSFQHSTDMKALVPEHSISKYRQHEIDLYFRKNLYIDSSTTTHFVTSWIETFLLHLFKWQCYFEHGKVSTT